MPKYKPSDWRSRQQTPFVDHCAQCDKPTPHIYIKGYEDNLQRISTRARCETCQTKDKGQF